MATSRQIRRAKERDENKRARKVSGVPFAKPTSEHGVEIGLDGERVLASFFVGYATVSFSWARHDAKVIGQMLIDEADKKAGDEDDVPVAVGESGLVIAHSIPDAPKPR